MKCKTLGYILSMILILINPVRGSSYNQLKFCSSASWNLNATTFADNNTIGTNPYDVFVTTNNTVYVVETSLNRVQIWLEGSVTPMKNISIGLSSPYSIFVTNNDDVYIDNGSSRKRVDKWTANATSSVPAMYVSGACYDIFVDINSSLYCSLGDNYQVIKRSFDDNINSTRVIAGNGTSGAAPNMLNGPRGIFVDSNVSLYVADCFNNRIQFFQSGQLNGTTMAGTGANGTIKLNCPIGITLDADGYLFIVDCSNNRVIGSGSNGFRCIIGCTTTAGSAANQLSHPRMFSFDSYGNLFVIDNFNYRVQKFLLQTNSCNDSMTTSPTSMSTTSIVEPSSDDIQSTEPITFSLPFMLVTSSFQTDDSTIAAQISTEAIDTAESSTDSIESTTSVAFSVASTSTILPYQTDESTTTLQMPTSATNTMVTPFDSIQSTTSISISLVSTLVTSSFQTVQQTLPSFVPDTCPNSTSIGIYCNITRTSCDMLVPCKNNGLCNNTNTTITGYTCSCLSGFNGTQCEFDYRPCKTNTCWNNGVCNETSDTTFVCSCPSGWTGINCQTPINYCQDIICQNDGVCRNMYLNYTCECLGDSYTGRYCEIISNKISVHQMISKSFAYIAIIAMTSVAMFIIIMDALKYCFHIDLTGKELQQIRRHRKLRQYKRHIIHRFA